MPDRIQPPPDPTIQATIRDAMARGGITQTELADAIGWQQSNVSAYLRGSRDISTRTLAKMLHAVGLEFSAKKRKKV